MFYAMFAFYRDLTPGQGTFLSAVITAIAAGVGVIFGAILFEGRVRDLKTAIDNSETILKDHLKALDEQFRSKLAGLGKIESGIDELQKSDTDGGDQIKQCWFAVREILEAIAASPDIDGRTRARYGRIDRRQYHHLIYALDQDRRLGRFGQKFLEALNTWHRFRSGRTVPGKEEIQLMQGLRDEILQSSLAKYLDVDDS